MRTALYDRHCRLGAKIVDFARWEMPVQYRGIIPEHLAVRQGVGIFDVSHMGRIAVKGPDAEELLDYLSTNHIAGKKEGSATYTVWCREDGGSVDDLIVYRESGDAYFVVANASNRDKDLHHLQQHAQGKNVAIAPLFDQAILAIQGPRAQALVDDLLDAAPVLKPMRCAQASFQGRPLAVASTGYTGAGGVELFGPADVIVLLWDKALERGAEPVGLGARDTLRLEMGYALYGHELSDTIAPIESVSAWTVKWDKGDFLGKKALVKLEASSKKRSAHGIVLTEPGIAREGYEVFKEGRLVGFVTSGTMAPSLKKAIALILVDGKLQDGENVEVLIRNKRVLAEVVPLPFR